MGCLKRWLQLQLRCLEEVKLAPLRLDAEPGDTPLPSLLKLAKNANKEVRGRITGKAPPLSATNTHKLNFAALTDDNDDDMATGRRRTQMVDTQGLALARCSL